VTSDPDADPRVELLSAAEKEVMWKRRDSEISFLLGIPGRATAALSIALPLIALLLGTFALVVAPMLGSRSAPTWAFVLLLVGLLVAVWYLVQTVSLAVVAIGPSGIDMLQTTPEFVEDSLSQIDPAQPKASVDRLVAAMIRAEIEQNKSWMEDRLHTLDRALACSRNGFIACIVLLIVALLVRFSFGDPMSKSTGSSPATNPVPSIPKPTVPASQMPQTVNQGKDAPAPRPSPKPATNPK
jgi:hypothetical protein